ncbi:hypothetical protein Tco_1074073 [Tanacetum coccineum]
MLRVTTRVVPRGVSTVPSLSGQPPPDDRSMVVNGGQRQSTPPDHRPTAAVNYGEPPLTTTGPPVKGGQRPGLSRIFEASRARGFVLRSLELQIPPFIMGKPNTLI